MNLSFEHLVELLQEQGFAVKVKKHHLKAKSKKGGSLDLSMVERFDVDRIMEIDVDGSVNLSSLKTLSSNRLRITATGGADLSHLEKVEENSETEIEVGEPLSLPKLTTVDGLLIVSAPSIVFDEFEEIGAGQLVFCAKEEISLPKLKTLKRKIGFGHHRETPKRFLIPSIEVIEQGFDCTWFLGTASFGWDVDFNFDGSTAYMTDKGLSKHYDSDCLDHYDLKPTLKEVFDGRVIWGADGAFIRQGKNFLPTRKVNTGENNHV